MKTRHYPRPLIHLVFYFFAFHSVVKKNNPKLHASTFRKKDIYNYLKVTRRPTTTTNIYFFFLPVISRSKTQVMKALLTQLNTNSFNERKNKAIFR